MATPEIPPSPATLAQESHVSRGALLLTGSALVAAGLLVASLSVSGNSEPDQAPRLSVVPTGPHVLLPGTPSPEATTPTPSAAATSTTITPRKSPDKPKPLSRAVGLVYKPEQGMAVPLTVGTTALGSMVVDRVQYTSIINPPVVYCPGTDPVKTTVPHTVAKTRKDCETWYEVTDYGEPHTVADTGAPDVATVLAAHTSVYGYDLSGNMIAGINGGQFVVTTATGAQYKYNIRTQHIHPRKGTADLGETIQNAPATSLLVVTCEEDNAGANDVVVADLVVTK